MTGSWRCRYTVIVSYHRKFSQTSKSVPSSPESTSEYDTRCWGSRRGCAEDGVCPLRRSRYLDFDLSIYSVLSSTLEAARICPDTDSYVRSIQIFSWCHPRIRKHLSPPTQIHGFKNTEMPFQNVVHESCSRWECTATWPSKHIHPTEDCILLQLFCCLPLPRPIEFNVLQILRACKDWLEQLVCFCYLYCHAVPWTLCRDIPPTVKRAKCGFSWLVLVASLVVLLPAYSASVQRTWLLYILFVSSRDNAVHVDCSGSDLWTKKCWKWTFLYCSPFLAEMSLLFRVSIPKLRREYHRYDRGEHVDLGSPRKPELVSKKLFGHVTRDFDRCHGFQFSWCFKFYIKSKRLGTI